jgi:hypothetical protein
MNLSDLRKVTLKKHLRIRFALSNGMECIVNEHGIAQVPALRAVPSFNLEDELVRVQTFVVEAAGGRDKDKDKDKGKTAIRSYTREQMAALAQAGAAAGPAHDEHDD